MKKSPTSRTRPYRHVRLSNTKRYCSKIGRRYLTKRAVPPAQKRATRDDRRRRYNTIRQLRFCSANLRLPYCPGQFHRDFSFFPFSYYHFSVELLFFPFLPLLLFPPHQIQNPAVPLIDIPSGRYLGSHSSSILAPLPSLFFAPSSLVPVLGLFPPS